jgi:hypothetical protein
MGKTGKILGKKVRKGELIAKRWENGKYRTGVVSK